MASDAGACVGCGSEGVADAGETPPEAGACVDCAKRDGGHIPPAESDSGVGSFVPDAAADASARDAESVVPTTDSSTEPPTYPKADLPAQRLDLSNWKLTVPLETDHPGNPDEYRNPELQTLTLAPYFTLTPEKDGVAFRAHAGGATTPNSSYPRSELREMAQGGNEHAAWSTSSGTHRMRVRQAITHVTAVKPEVVSAQIHDGQDDVVMVRLEEEHLFVEGDGELLGTLDANYQLGTAFTIEIVATNGTIEVLYNGQSKARLERAADGCYFKAGCYTQSNVERGEKPDAYAQVVIYDLVVTHE